MYWYAFAYCSPTPHHRLQPQEARGRMGGQCLPTSLPHPTPTRARESYPQPPVAHLRMVSAHMITGLGPHLWRTTSRECQIFRKLGTADLTFLWTGQGHSWHFKMVMVVICRVIRDLAIVGITWICKHFHQVHHKLLGHRLGICQEGHIKVISRRRWHPPPLKTLVTPVTMTGLLVNRLSMCEVLLFRTFRKGGIPEILRLILIMILGEHLTDMITHSMNPQLLIFPKDMRILPCSKAQSHIPRCLAQRTAAMDIISSKKCWSLRDSQVCTSCLLPVTWLQLGL